MVGVGVGVGVDVGVGVGDGVGVGVGLTAGDADGTKEGIKVSSSATIALLHPKNIIDNKNNKQNKKILFFILEYNSFYISFFA